MSIWNIFKRTKTQTSFSMKLINAEEAALCKLLVANVTMFGNFRVDYATLADVIFGHGGYCSRSPETTLRLICENYGWTFTKTTKHDGENDMLFWFTIYKRKSS